MKHNSGSKKSNTTVPTYYERNFSLLNVIIGCQHWHERFSQTCTPVNQSCRNYWFSGNNCPNFQVRIPKRKLPFLLVEFVAWQKLFGAPKIQRTGPTLIFSGFCFFLRQMPFTIVKAITIKTCLAQRAGTDVWKSHFLLPKVVRHRFFPTKIIYMPSHWSQYVKQCFQSTFPKMFKYFLDNNRILSCNHIIFGTYILYVVFRNTVRWS